MKANPRRTPPMTTPTESTPAPTLRELIKTATPGPWMHLIGDTVLYTRLNDGCRGMHVAKVLDISPEPQANAQLIARCNPATMLLVVEALEKSQDRLKRFDLPSHEISTALAALNSPTA